MKSRDRYDELLLRVSTHGDWRAWLAYFLTGVERQAQDAIVRGRSLMDLQADWRIELRKAGVSGALPALADYLFERPILSGKQVVARPNVSHQTAMQSLRRLEELGMVQEARCGRPQGSRPTAAIPPNRRQSTIGRLPLPR